MPFNLRETVFGWRHLAIGVERGMLKRSPHFFLNKLKSEGVPASAVQQGKDWELCPVCGYAIAEVSLENGLLMQSCSALELNKLLKSPGLATWSESHEDKSALIIGLPRSGP